MTLRTTLAAAAAVAAVATGAQAALIPTLDTITANASDFTFDYSSTLSPDSGLVAGNRFVIYDFDGYVAGSVFSPFSFFTASTEQTTTGLLTLPGFVDDPTKTNLVFTYTGAAYHASSGPFAPTDYMGFTARSIYGGQVLSAFAAKTTKNNPNNRVGGTGTPIFDTGNVTVPAPSAAVPEPATWAMMILGFGGAGVMIRRRRTSALLA